MSSSHNTEETSFVRRAQRKLKREVERLIGRPEADATQSFPPGFNEDFYQLLSVSDLFDETWYRATYNVPDDVDAAIHYVQFAHCEGYFPTPDFSTANYLLQNRDVLRAGIDPFYHYLKHGKEEGRKFSDNPYELPQYYPEHCTPSELDIIKRDLSDRSKRAEEIQNERIAQEYPADTKKLIVFLVPPLDYAGGGVMSISSIARVTRELSEIHNAHVIIATLPNPSTFYEYSTFDSGFSVYRFEQLHEHFHQLDEILIHFPEVLISNFFYGLSAESIIWLKRIPKRAGNILNQNISLLPDVTTVDFLRRYLPVTTMTVAHRKYCVKQLRSSYDLSVHFLSTSNLVHYDYKPYREKSDLLVYSSDDNPYKEIILEAIKSKLPSLETKEIKDLKYPEYLEIISRAKWMITFGEGVDGYFLESVRSGAVAFSVYNFAFFDDRFDGLPTIYSSYAEMLEGISGHIESLDNPETFKETSDRLIALDKEVYDDSEYCENIRNFYLGNYTFPYEEILPTRRKNLAENPLISIVMATYNSERFLRAQLESLDNLIYKNTEIIISDDGSTDSTWELLENHDFHSPVKLVNNPGPHGPASNFSNALQYAKGKYVALCDHDDIWFPDKLNVLLERIEDYDLIHGRVRVIDADGDYHTEPVYHTSYEMDLSKKTQLSDFFFTHPILGSSSLIRRSIIDPLLPLPEELIFHDWWILLNAIQRGNGICFVNKEVINYRQYGENVARTFYNTPKFQDRLITFINFVEKELGATMTKQELELLDVYRNWCKMYQLFQQIMPSLSYEYFNSNFESLTHDALLLIDRTIDALLAEGTR